MQLRINILIIDNFKRTDGNFLLVAKTRCTKNMLLLKSARMEDAE